MVTKHQIILFTFFVESILNKCAPFLDKKKKKKQACIGVVDRDANWLDLQKKHGGSKI